MTGLRIDAAVADRSVRLDLELPSNTRLGVVGPNGAGKSTLVQLVTGQLRPSSGTVTWQGEVLSGPGRFVPIHRRGFALLAQRPTLFAHLNVLDNVAFGLRSVGLSRAVARARAADELDRLGVADLASRRSTALSGGQAQRVCLARALVTDPAVVLLDEPFTGMDTDTAARMRALLRERLAGLTVILVTHDPIDLWALTDRVARLEDGRVTGTIDTSILFSAPTDAQWAGLAGLNLVSWPPESSPGSPTAPGLARRSLIDPAHVELAVADPRLPTPPDRWAGQVSALRSQGSSLLVTVAVEQGPAVNVLLPLGKAGALMLDPGTPVWLRVPEAAVRPV